MSEIGLTESCKSDSRKFEVWRNARAEIFILQPVILDLKDEWVRAIQRVLLSQLEFLRERVYSSQESKLALALTRSSPITFRWVKYILHFKFLAPRHILVCTYDLVLAKPGIFSL